MYLNRALNREGNMIDFYLSKTRHLRATKRFFKTPCYHSRQETSLSYSDWRFEGREKDAYRHPNKAGKIS